MPIINRLLLVSCMAFSLAGCWESDTENAAEDVGESIERTTEDAGDAIEDAGDKIEDKAEEANTE